MHQGGRIARRNTIVLTGTDLAKHLLSRSPAITRTGLGAERLSRACAFPEKVLDIVGLIDLSA